MFIDIEQFKNALQIAGQDPVSFIERVFDCKLWAKQQEIVKSVQDNRYTVVRSCYCSGKSFTAVQIAAWYLLTHVPSKVILTSSSHVQVQRILMGELASIYRRSKIPVGGELTALGLTLSGDHFIIGMSPKIDVDSDAYRSEGFHSPNVLVILDQAQGINAKLWDVATSLITTASSRLLVLGNPISKSGKFYNACQRGDIFHSIKISAFDTPNVVARTEIVPGLITHEWVKDRELEWGVKHPLYISKVLGEFPEEDSNVLIALGPIESAVDREFNDGSGYSMGVDVARFGEDKSVIVIMLDGRVVAVHEFSQQDLMRLVGQIKHLTVQYNIQPNLIAIDESGVGGGVIDRLREDDKFINVIPVNNGAKAIDHERFADLGSELWWRMREKFESGTISIPDHSQLKMQLADRSWHINSSGKTKIESKDDMKKRGVKSPDHADALALAIHATRHGLYNQPRVSVFTLNEDEE